MSDPLPTAVGARGVPTWPLVLGIVLVVCVMLAAGIFIAVVIARVARRGDGDGDGSSSAWVGRRGRTHEQDGDGDGDGGDNDTQLAAGEASIDAVVVAQGSDSRDEFFVMVSVDRPGGWAPMSCSAPTVDRTRDTCKQANIAGGSANTYRVPLGRSHPTPDYLTADRVRLVYRPDDPSRVLRIVRLR